MIKATKSIKPGLVAQVIDYLETGNKEDYELELVNNFPHVTLTRNEAKELANFIKGSM